MKRNLYIILILAIASLVSSRGTSQKAKGPQMKWYGWDEGYEIAKKENKLIYIHVFNDGCSYCKKMDKKTYVDPHVVSTLNYNCVNIRINADDEKTLYKMDKYTLTSHQLLLLIAQQRIVGYPSQVFIMPGEFVKKRGVAVETGYLDPKDFMKKLDLMLVKKREADDRRCPDGKCS